tara:strand:- start:601 stop:1002 length:402 start_codon:yes stop_codon:yes gene_type:complete
MKITKTRLKQIIKEELKETIGPFSIATGVTPEPQGLGPSDLMDTSEEDPDAVYNNVKVASRILEELPLDILPEQVVDAAQNLRDALVALEEQGYGNKLDKSKEAVPNFPTPSWAQEKEESKPILTRNSGPTSY